MRTRARAAARADAGDIMDDFCKNVVLNASGDTSVGKISRSSSLMVASTGGKSFKPGCSTGSKGLSFDQRMVAKQTHQKV